jgi:uncharacterized membrane protein
VTKNRLEAFSDGVLAIIITIMVLELKVPHGHNLNDLLPILPVLAGYVLSFIYIGIYWNNHHHLLHAVHRINGSAMWANLHLLFWLSLLPVATHWIGETHFAKWPVVVYGFVMLMSGFAYWILERVLIAHHGTDSLLAKAIGKDAKGIASLAIYIVGIAIAFLEPLISCGLYCLVAAIWLVPDRRIEKSVHHSNVHGITLPPSN